MSQTTLSTGVAAGVPYIAVPPETAAPNVAPVVVAWHMMDPPRSEAAFAAALPLAGLDAWRIYLGLPLFGSRLPAGGLDAIMRLGMEGGILKLQGPVIDQAAAEFEPALTELRSRLGFGRGPVGLVGGSAGAAVAQLVLAESDVAVSAAVLVSPVVQVRALVEAMERLTGVAYRWSERAQEVARRLDFVARASELDRHRNQPAILLAVGQQDDPAFHASAAALKDALARRYADPARVELAVIPGMGHSLAAEPGIVPAPQTREAAAVDRLAVQWLRRHLTSPRSTPGLQASTG